MFLDEWNKVSEDRRPSCFAAGLKGYTPGEQLLWIVAAQNPDDWMQPLPPASLLPQPQSLLTSYLHSVPEPKGADPPQKGKLWQCEQYSQPLVRSQIQAWQASVKQAAAPKVQQHFVPYGRAQICSKPARFARTLPRGDRTDMPGCEVCELNTHESFAHFLNHNSPALSEWIMPVMYGEFLPPTLHL
eukprot:6491684-Amphidinium_carterae.9